MIPENHNSIWVGEIYPFYRWDCDMYLSWPNYFTKENHPGPSFKWSMQAYEDKSIRNMKCVLCDEPLDKDLWGDNALCLPADSPFEMKFVSNSRQFDDWDYTDCVKLEQPWQKSSEGWSDNYFCTRLKDPKVLQSRSTLKPIHLGLK